MVDKVEITQEPTNSPTLEEQAKQQEEKSQPEAQTQETSSEERPSWLPDKFSNAEELAKAYGALETKLFCTLFVARGYRNNSFKYCIHCYFSGYMSQI